MVVAIEKYVLGNGKDTTSMKRAFHMVSGVGLAILVLSSSAQAQMKPEELLKLRQGVMVTIKSQFGPLAALAKNDAPVTDDAIAKAETLAVLAKLPSLGFAAGTEDLRPSKAKPEIWQKADDFAKLMEALATEAGRLATVAKTRDVQAFKAQVAATGKTCKTCHDTYRAE